MVSMIEWLIRHNEIILSETLLRRLIVVSTVDGSPRRYAYSTQQSL